MLLGLPGSIATSIAPVVPLSPSRTRIHVSPPSVVRYRPRSPPGTKRLPAEATNTRLGFAGSTAIRPMAPEVGNPIDCHVAPPSLERYMPVPPQTMLPPPGLASPVPT